MSASERDGLMPCLFSGQGVSVANVKFFRGTRDIISAEDFCGEVHAAIVQKRTEGAELSVSPPRSARSKVDVRKFVADM